LQDHQSAEGAYMKEQPFKVPLLRSVIPVAVLLVFASNQAYAYIDPGTGSFILQMLLAGFFTLMFMLKKVRARIKKFVVGLFKGKTDDEPK